MEKSKPKHEAKNITQQDPISVLKEISKTSKFAPYKLK